MAKEIETIETAFPSPIVPYIEDDDGRAEFVLINAHVKKEFLSELEVLVTEFSPDISTDRGRTELASFAHRFIKFGAAVKRAGKKINDATRKKITDVNYEVTDIAAKIDALRVRARQPLTDWERLEDERANDKRLLGVFFKNVSTVQKFDTAADIAGLIEFCEAKDISPYEELFSGIRAEALQTLRDAHAHAVKEEADRAELERLRAAEEMRKREEAAALAKREREEKPITTMQVLRYAADLRNIEVIGAPKPEIIDHADDTGTTPTVVFASAPPSAGRTPWEPFSVGQDNACVPTPETRAPAGWEVAETSVTEDDDGRRAAAIIAAQAALMSSAWISSEEAGDVMRAIIDGMISGVTFAG